MEANELAIIKESQSMVRKAMGMLGEIDPDYLTFKKDQILNNAFSQVFEDKHGEMISAKLELARKIKELVQQFEMEYGIGVTEITPIKQDKEWQTGNSLFTELIVIKMLVW
jgi:hypothetical protein